MVSAPTGSGFLRLRNKPTDFDKQWICGQVANYNGGGTKMQAFRWNRADADLTLLGSLAPAGGGDTVTIAAWPTLSRTTA